MDRSWCPPALPEVRARVSGRSPGSLFHRRSECFRMGRILDARAWLDPGCRMGSWTIMGETTIQISLTRSRNSGLFVQVSRLAIPLDR